MATGEGSSRSGFGTFLLIFVPLVIVGIVGAALYPGANVERPPAPRHLNVVATYSPSGFRISNNDDYDWGSCDLTLNDDYKLTGVRVPSRDVITVPAGEFTTSNGTRFNLYTTKPLQLYVHCRSTDHGTRASLVGWR